MIPPLADLFLVYNAFGVRKKGITVLQINSLIASLVACFRRNTREGGRRQASHLVELVGPISLSLPMIDGPRLLGFLLGNYGVKLLKDGGKLNIPAFLVTKNGLLGSKLLISKAQKENARRLGVVDGLDETERGYQRRCLGEIVS
ncbi:hypothetical protein Tco_0821982 [Tanacetum coccineum]|uniref:Uncharacterized protein n=1 Tax=Tanacetum coccineum TaxID=301880 RepID=A0ABQ5AI41_9ASTR